MKIPLSYKRDFFRRALAFSLVGHAAVLLGASSGILPVPHFDVEAAPSSMEMVLVEEPPPREIPKPEEVLTILEETKEAPEIAEKPTPEKEEKPLPEEEVPPLKGALTEREPVSIRNPAPLYPRVAREQGWEGVVLLRVLVSRQGEPVEIRVRQSSGHPVLDQSAVSAVRSWRFIPARVGKLAFSCWIEIPFRFILDRSKGIR